MSYPTALSWSRRAVVSLGSLLLIIAACSKKAPDGPIPQDTGEVAIQVENHHLSDVDIFVYHDGQLNRVGTVTASRTETILFPSTLLGHSRQIRLRADAIGSPEAVWSPTVVVQPGAWIEWTLELSLRTSSIAVH